ncbi:hypothetical protein CLOSTHATH_00536 [Hungatella hathewayi DSM 13479]|uniref:Uncharacterized protein n=1 Tax=Hungatella hathewayi DSM 13479 TaxID=566550 RepID=D3AAB5_9FIRM|nr:hypothetical protein CLOSTHATH_00536 [Hungatella hathewayi DSM 13479]
MAGRERTGRDAPVSLFIINVKKRPQNRISYEFQNILQNHDAKKTL